MGTVIDELDLILGSSQDSAPAIQEPKLEETPAVAPGAKSFKEDIIKALEGGDASDTDEKREIIKAMEQSFSPAE